MVGTALSVLSISLLALAGTGVPLTSQATVVALLQALVSALAMNVAIVGINQLYDIEIDKVNKPYLPLASGALTPAQGLAIVVVSSVVGTGVGLAAGSPPLLATLLVSLALGVAYSADHPLLRWKRSPVLAAACILAVRAIIVQLGFYAHMRAAVLGAGAAAAGAVGTGVGAAKAAAAGAAAAASAASTSAAPAGLAGGLSGLLGWLTASYSPSVLFVATFMLFFSIVIALFKDIPDVLGDRQAGMRTLSVRLGEGAVFRLCVGLLAAAYCWAMAASLVLPGSLPARAALFVGHALLCGLLLVRSRAVDTRSRAGLADHYMFVWKLFYAEYLLIPLFG
ncbi:hypothetical protein HYH03_010285 [Edaphochlamys debaryana]|uniref:Homogentisate phytyltransferase n=1 Tax=Edaphochlamys debaryana TaxID=47281 RepID=A0A835XWU6_9CHLO|nr:hypothetical protein HYH03_010285 [Edaphochlamys debaryana]|eukprot:KAG2491279.1 hypothetical protein HYH03_010285 [Edaphochlamys debaryana]